LPADFKEKSSIRKEVSFRRDGLSKEERKAKSENIARRLLELPEFINAQAILFYASFRSEVDTIELLKNSIGNKKRVVLPKVDMRSMSLMLYEIYSMEDLKPGCLGILEPLASRGRAVNTGDIDFMIIPGVAFDEHCNRLGYGKGFYDRLLAVKKSPAVALAYEEQVVENIPADVHDIKMDKIITDKRIIHCHGH